MHKNKTPSMKSKIHELKNNIQHTLSKTSTLALITFWVVAFISYPEFSYSRASHDKVILEVLMQLHPNDQQKDTLVKTPVIPEKKDTTVVSQVCFSNTFWRHVSISLVPYICSNRLFSVNTANDVSFNVIAGYSIGVRAFELGSMLNIDNGDVRYVQIAGMANVVTGHSKGAQVAGVLNLNGKSVQGVQIAGIGNVSSKATTGVQLSGIFNASGRKVKGAQLSGICNTTPSLKGVQASGVVNVADTLKGVQLAGVANISGQMHGVQVSGVLNQAANVTGVQVGLVNLADSSSGVSIGLFNYVKTGYHKLEISTDELLFGNVSFGTGTEKLHTIFTAGINYAKPSIIAYGCGLGTGFTIRNRLSFSASVIAQQMRHTKDGFFRANVMGRAYIGLEYKLHPKFRIGLGPTFNLYSPNTIDNYNSDLLTGVPSYRLGESTAANDLRMWVGGKLSLKFF
jgi:hypothetical protein